MNQVIGEDLLLYFSQIYGVLFKMQNIIVSRLNLLYKFDIIQ